MQVKFRVKLGVGVGEGRWLELVETNTDTDKITVGTDKIIKVLGNKGPSSLNVADQLLSHWMSIV